MEQENDVIYREVQQPRRIWLLIPALFFWFVFIKQVIMGLPVGTKPMSDIGVIIIWFIVGVLLLIWPQICAKLVIEVRKEGLYIRYVPLQFRFKSFAFEDILEYKAIKYGPIRRFGGWGIRFNAKGERAYNMIGNKGVELQLTNNKIIVIGTRNPDELVESIRLAKEAE